MGLESRMFDWKSFSTVLHNLKAPSQPCAIVGLLDAHCSEKLSTTYGKKVQLLSKPFYQSK